MYLHKKQDADNRDDRFLCDGWLPMTGNGSLLDDLERLKETLNASLLRAFEGLGAAMMAKSKQSSSHSGSRNGEYTATDEYECVTFFLVS
jgi:hypothetical protein